MQWDLISEDISCGSGNDNPLFQKGQITRLHQAQKAAKEIAEMTKVGSRTFQCIF